MLEECEKTFY